MTMLEIIDTVTRVSGVQAAAICDYDGILIEGYTATDLVEREHLCAWAAEMGRAAAKTTESWEGGALRVALFESSVGSLMLADVGKGYLVAVGDPTTNLGLLRLEIERAAAMLRRALSTAVLSEGIGN